MRVINLSLKATLHIFALITHQGGSVELANNLKMEFPSYLSSI
jgi:hypothetical protein